MIRVSFQGEPGAYSELAIVQHFGNSVETLPCRTFAETLEAVEKNEVDYDMLPIENSTEGSVVEVYDLLLSSELEIIGEEIVRVQHCLISHPDSALKDIKRVYSHPQALGQCRKFLEENKLEAVPAYDTAGSVKMIKESGEKDVAAIASEIAARVYSMKILAKGIEANPHNYTRFLLLGRGETKPSGNDKTSIIFSTKHEPGALIRALQGFAEEKISLTKLESRPIIGKPWEYNFFVDFEGHVREIKVKEAIALARNNTTFLKILGSYPRSKS